jgi:hypothetical protein
MKYTTVRSQVSPVAIQKFELAHRTDGTQMRRTFAYSQEFLDAFMPIFRADLFEKYKQFGYSINSTREQMLSEAFVKIQAMKNPTDYIDLHFRSDWRNGDVVNIILNAFQIHQYIVCNLEKFIHCLDIIFPNICKLDGVFYVMPTEYKNSENFESNYIGDANVSVWRESITAEDMRDVIVLVASENAKCI